MKKPILNKKKAKQDPFQKSVEKRNKLTALAGLGGILVGLGSAWAFSPQETKDYLGKKAENAIYVAGARESEVNSPSFAIPFTRYNHIDTSESVKSDILQARRDLGENFGNFIYQTAQNQSRAVSGKIYPKNSIEELVKQQDEIVENQKNWEVKKPETKTGYNDYNNYIVNPDFISYIIHVESSGRANAVGSSGERGLMQIMGSTWHDATKRVYGQATSFDKAFKPEENIKAGVAQLEWLEQVYLPTKISNWNTYSEKKKRDSIIAAYNLGPSKFVKSYNGNPYNPGLPITTRNYISKVDSLVYGKKQVADAVHQWASIIKDAFED